MPLSLAKFTQTLVFYYGNIFGQRFGTFLFHYLDSSHIAYPIKSLASCKELEVLAQGRLTFSRKKLHHE